MRDRVILFLTRHFILPSIGRKLDGKMRCGRRKRSRLGHARLLHSACKYSCISWIAVAPSPTADATRLTERERASPAANTPGMLVSKKKGSRSSLHPLGG